MTDIAERLRNAAALSLNEYGEADRYREAADEIERLRAVLREMVQVNAAFARTIVTAAATGDLEDELRAAGIADGFGERARAALGEPKP